jgi:glycerate-2-kinase
VICLLSGGASALWCDLLPGITIGDMQTMFDLLIRSGAGIHEINTVRKHLSRIKGGQLLRYCGGAKLFSLIISDVPGDDISVIASGPTTGDSSSFADVFRILNTYQLLEKMPAAVRIHLDKGLNGIITETPKHGDELFRHTQNMIIGSNSIALKAAEKKAKALGYTVLLRNEIVTGDTVTEAKAFISQLLQHKGNKPVCFLQGGETTIKVTGNGKGGRNQHFVLSALKEIKDNFINAAEKNFIILSGGTDGTDGPTDATGAIANPDTLKILSDKNLSIELYLDNHDAYHLFEQTNGLLKTGPTQTNVMDMMLGILN